MTHSTKEQSNVQYLTVFEWTAFKDRLPPNNGKMIWWDDLERMPRLVVSRDFSHEDSGYWMPPAQPAPRGFKS